MKRNMRAGKSRNGGLEFKVFTDDELDEIHLATLEILEKTGLFVLEHIVLGIDRNGVGFGTCVLRKENSVQDAEWNGASMECSAL